MILSTSNEVIYCTIRAHLVTIPWKSKTIERIEFMLVAEKNLFFSPPDTYQLMVNWWFGASCGLDIWDFSHAALGRAIAKLGQGCKHIQKKFSFAKRTLMDVIFFFWGGNFSETGRFWGMCPRATGNMLAVFLSSEANFTRFSHTLWGILRQHMYICIFEHIVLWAGLVYVDHLAVHHSLIHATFGSSQNSLKLSQTNLIGRNPFWVKLKSESPVVSVSHL